MMKTRYASVEPYTTLDGSQIRELMHPAHHAAHGNRAQSFAEAIVAPGATTRLHRHHVTEEIYHITQGAGRMTLGDTQFDVAAGDTICIAGKYVVKEGDTPSGVASDFGISLDDLYKANADTPGMTAFQVGIEIVIPKNSDDC